MKMKLIGFLFMVLISIGSLHADCENGIDQSSSLYNYSIGKYQRWVRCFDLENNTSIAYQETITRWPGKFVWSSPITVLRQGDDAGHYEGGVWVAGDFDEENINYPSVLILNGVYHMWYHGGQTDQGTTILSIGHATSSDGKNWVKDVNNPVVVRDFNNPNTWDYLSVQSPDVTYEAGVYKMWFAGLNKPLNQTDSRIRIGYATSSDGSNWNKLENYVMDVGSDLSWDSKRVVFPRIIKINSTYHMLFTGDSYIETTCGGVPCHTSDYTYDIGHATSTDGVNWMKDANPYLEADNLGLTSVYAGEILQTIGNEYIIIYSHFEENSGPYDLRYWSFTY